MITVGAPEQIGGPTCCNYDSPATAIVVNSPNSNTLYQQRQYSADQTSYLIYNDGQFLSDPAEIGLTRGSDKSDLDYCGAWLNSAINNLKNDSLNIVYGFYHEEWNCNYSDNSYTNKSIAYSISYNGGLNFTKPNYPDNQIILPSNTTSQHQTGEGDHEIAVINDTVLYLYFTEWDGNKGNGNWAVTYGLAKSEEKGYPGTWYKYLNGQFNSPGLGGDSTAIAGLTGTSVRYRAQYQDFIAMGNGNTNANIMGHGPRLSFSEDGINNWMAMNSSLIWVDGDDWNRNPPVGELVAYSSLISRDIIINEDKIYNFVYNNSYWLYYTYLQPNETFKARYNVRRKVDIEQFDDIVPDNVAQTRVVLSHYYNNDVQDSWFTTAMIPNNNGYKNMGDIVGMLMTRDIDNENTVKVYDCYLEGTRDHMIGFDGECNVILRTLGWLYKTEINNKYIETQPIYRCYNDTIYNHFISLDTNCDNQGKSEFMMGYIITK